MDDHRADRDPAVQDGVPGMADGPILRARLHRADHGARDHQHLREVPQPGEGTLRWLPSRPRASSCCNRAAIALVVRDHVIYLLPLYWIASTAFKPRSLATTVPPTVVFEPEVTPFVKLFTKRVQMLRPGRAGGLCEGAVVGEAGLRSRRALHQGLQRQDRSFGLSEPVPQQHHHCGHQHVPGGRDGHAHRLRLLALSHAGRAGLAVLHPVARACCRRWWWRSRCS